MEIDNSPEDVFKFLDTRIDELKHKYKDIEKKYFKKHKIISKVCIICFDDFHPETEVIQLQCNINHIYH